MDVYSNGSRSSSSFTNLGDPAPFKDDDFDWMMNTIPIDGDPTMGSTFHYPSGFTLPAQHPQQVARLKSTLPPAGSSSSPSSCPLLSAWAFNPTPQLKEALEALTLAENKILVLKTKLASSEQQTSHAEDQFTDLLVKVESVLDIFNGVEGLRPRQSEEHVAINW